MVGECRILTISEPILELPVLRVQIKFHVFKGTRIPNIDQFRTNIGTACIKRSDLIACFERYENARY